MQLQCRFWHLSPGTNKQTHRCRNTLARARALAHRRCLHIFLPTEQQSTHMCAITHTQAKAVLSGWSIVSCAGEGWWLQTAVKAPRTRGWHPLSTEQGEMSNTGSGAPSLSLHTAPPLTFARFLWDALDFPQLLPPILIVFVNFFLWISFSQGFLQMSGSFSRSPYSESPSLTLFHQSLSLLLSINQFLTFSLVWNIMGFC